MKLKKALSRGSKGSVRTAKQKPRQSWPTEVYLPTESIGECSFSGSCSQFNVLLADGLCTHHWDKTTQKMLNGAVNAR